MSAEQNRYAAPRARVDDVAAPAAATGPQGIGGWLILPLLGLIATPFRVGFLTLRDLLPAFQPETWNVLTTPGSGFYHPLWAPMLIFEVTANCVVILFSIVLLWLFFKKSKRVPMLVITWYLVIIGAQIVDEILGGRIPAVAAADDGTSLRELARSVGTALIWIPYFLVSKRVKNTFVR